MIFSAKYFNVSLFIIIAHFEFTFVNCDEHEKRLYELLLSNYNVLERPVENNSLPVVVFLGLFFQQIIDLVNFRFLIRFVGHNQKSLLIG